MGRKSKTFDAYGHGLTINQIAELVERSPEAVRISLNAGDGNAERYLAKYGIDDEMILCSELNRIDAIKKAEAKAKAEAVDAIMEIIEPNADVEKPVEEVETPVDEIKVPFDDVVEEDMQMEAVEEKNATITDEDVKAMEEIIGTPYSGDDVGKKEREVLRKMNQVIDLLEDLDVYEVMDRGGLDTTAVSHELKKARVEAFVHLVDWDMVAYGA